MESLSLEYSQEQTLEVQEENTPAQARTKHMAWAGRESLSKAAPVKGAPCPYKPVFLLETENLLCHLQY